MQLWLVLRPVVHVDVPGPKQTRWTTIAVCHSFFLSTHEILNDIESAYGDTVHPLHIFHNAIHIRKSSPNSPTQRLAQ
jgi:hypothetical protein